VPDTEIKTNQPGSQAKNLPLMGLLATVLNMPIIIPPQPSAAVVLGAAMLGKFAHDLSINLGKPITTQSEAAEAQKQGGKLWNVMVEMTQPGHAVLPRSGEEGKREKKLLDVKYKIFREAVEVQKRWRGMIAEVEQ
jgi:ribulose kinase